MATTENKTTLHRLLTAVVILLAVAVGVQTWFLYNLKKELNVIHAEQRTTESKITANTQNDVIKPESLKSSENTKKAPSITNTSGSSDNSAAETQTKTEEKTQAIAPDTIPPWTDDNYFFPLFDAQTWSPYQEIQRMQRELDRRFNNHFNRFYNDSDPQHPFGQHFKTPKLKLRENEYQYDVTVNLPGADADDISVTLDGQILTVRGRQDYENTNNDALGNTVFRERRSGSFQRSIRLRQPVEKNAMKTHIDNGILTIIIPKMQ